MKYKILTSSYKHCKAPLLILEAQLERTFKAFHAVMENYHQLCNFSEISSLPIGNPHEVHSASNIAVTTNKGKGGIHKLRIIWGVIC